jgi:hypothetical protein
MADFVETPSVDLVLSLDAVKDETGSDLVLLTMRLENGATVRIPMSITAAMRVWGLLDMARRDKGWPVDTMPILANPIQ